MRRLAALALSAVLVLSSSGIPGKTFAADPKTAGRIQAEFFVSPDGDDANDGSYEKPFATIKAAKEAVQKINGNMTGDIYVFLDSGQYYMEDTLVFGEKDSGTNGYKIVYRNLDEVGSAELIGGQKVTSKWELVDASGDPAVDADADLPASAEGKVYKTHVGTDVDFNTLYVNDERATLARTQNRANENGFDSALTPYMRSAGGGVGDLVYKAGDLDEDSINGMVNAQKRGDLNASVYMWDGGYWDWMTDTIPVSAIDVNARRLTYKTVAGHPEIYRPKYATRNNARYFVQGNLGFLDVPGEYYFNEVTGDLYYYPEGNIEDQEIVIPYVKEIIRVEGTSRDSMVENIEFSGITVKDADHTEWYAYGWNWGDAGDGLGFYPKEAEGSTQPSYCEQTERIEFQYGNITLKNTRNIAITKTRIKNSGMFGIELYLANQNARIEDCMIEYTAHGGINVDGGYPGVAGDANGDGYSRDNVIRNCIVHDIGELVGQASGITIQQSSYNTVSHVEVYNSPRRGLFLTAGHSRNGGTAFPNGDKNYNPMTELYTHHNTIEYAYLHDCQQDGGDDGAFFACYLWKGKNNKPNYVNQMVIENVAANPSMTDIAPNGINLDMGASGMELSNVKVVNPQHFNIEVNTITQYGDSIKFDNVNVDFGKHTNHLKSFDDSRMEYDKIGVTADFPSEFQQGQDEREELDDIYFSEDFENGIDYNKWSAKGNPEITTEWMSEGVLGGRQALMINSDSGKPVLYREFAESLNKVVTMKLFDRAGFNICSYDSGVSINVNITTYGRVDDGEHAVGMGIDNAIGGGSNGVYVLQIGDEKIKTDIGRFFGWHELKWDYSSGTDVKLYFDGKLVKTLTEADGVSTSFDYVAMGSEAGSGVTFFDELTIYGGREAGDPGSVALPQIPEYDSSNDNKEQLFLDFEDGQLPEFYFTSNDPNRVSQAIEEEAGNKVLKHYSGDGHAFYQTNAEWDNYLVNFKWKFGGWGDVNVLDYAYDNFTIYVMTTSDGSTKQNNNPCAYQVVYRRNKNGAGEGFPAGTPYFEICKHTPSSDSSLGKVALPEGFNDQEWHDFQIQTFDGKVGFVIDGTPLLSIDDGQYTHGGIGFGGINSTCYLDNIQIITNPVSNAELSLDFEDGQLPEFYFTSDDVNRVTQAIAEEDGNKILKHYSGDGHAFYQTNASWENYLVNFKWKFGGWGNVNVLNYAYDNFTIYVMTTSDGSTKQNNNPPAYQVVYRRNKNGAGEGFPAGTPYFEICKHTPSSDSSLGKIALPEGFNDQEWHDFQIQTFDGKVGFVVDGVTLLSADDGQYTHGGIGFGGINSTCYLDDIEIITNPSYVTYDKKLGLTNIEMNGVFNPNYYDYYVAVKDTAKDVTFKMPRVTAAGVKLTATINGEAITDMKNAVTLELRNGINELVITEGAAAGDKVYRVKIHKAMKVSGTEAISAVITETGVEPKLPATVNVTFADGSTQETAINWKRVHPSMYKKNVTFTAKGSLDGFAYEVETTVEVQGLESVDRLSEITTKAGTAPVLPETVTARYSDGDRALALTFAEMDSKLYENAGTVVCVAQAEGYTGVVLQIVKVEADEPVVKPVNKYLLQRTYDYAVTLSTDGVVESAKAYFENTLAAAKAVLEDENATQAQVDEAWDNLLDGIWGLGIYKGDKGALKELIDQANAMNKDDYEAENWGMLEDALAEAQAVYADEDATQDVVDVAREELQKAIDAQVLKPVVDKSILKQLIDKAIAMLPEEARYVAENWPKLVESLEKGQSVYENDAATQEEVNAAADELLNAIIAQRFKANKSNLEKLVKEAEGIDTACYTEETVSVFRAALANAKIVLADETLSENDQKIVDDAAKVLADAKAALKEKTSTDDGAKNENTGNDSPKTGDTMPIALWMMLAMLAFAMTGAAARRMAKNKK